MEPSIPSILFRCCSSERVRIHATVTPATRPQMQTYYLFDLRHFHLPNSLLIATNVSWINLFIYYLYIYGSEACSRLLCVLRSFRDKLRFVVIFNLCKIYDFSHLPWLLCRISNVQYCMTTFSRPVCAAA